MLELEIILKTYVIAAFTLFFILFSVGTVIIAVIGTVVNIRLDNFLQKNYPDIWRHITTVPIISPTGGGDNPIRSLKLLFSPPDKLKADPEFQRLRKPVLCIEIGMGIVFFSVFIIGFSIIIMALIWP